MQDNLPGSQHIDGPDCWCRPTLYFTMDGFDGVWLHHEPDGSYPPPELLIEAIVVICLSIGNNMTNFTDNQPAETFEANIGDLHAIYEDMQDEPDPVHNDGPDMMLVVIDDIQARRQIGMLRYGTPLQAFNGRSSLRDAYWEAIDLAVYLRTKIYEEEHPDLTKEEAADEAKNDLRQS